MSCLIGVPYQVPPIGLLVLGHWLPVHLATLIIQTIKWFIILGELIVCLFQNCKVFSSSTACKGNIELMIGSFTV